MANDATFGKAIHPTANFYDFCFVMKHFLSLWSLQQNQDRKHRTYVYVLTVTETLEAWEDSVNIGRVSHRTTPHFLRNTYTYSASSLLRSGSSFKLHSMLLFTRRRIDCTGHLIGEGVCSANRCPLIWATNLGCSLLQLSAGTCSNISCLVNAITPCRYVFKYERDAVRALPTCIAGKTTGLVRSLWCKMCCLRVALLLVVSLLKFSL